MPDDELSETKITNGDVCLPNIPGYIFEHVPTPLASGGAGLIDETIYYALLEKTSNESFLAFWTEIRFSGKKYVIVES